MAPRAGNVVDPKHDTRAERPPLADERATLVGFLAWQRDTLALKCEGLSAEQLAEQSVPPSTMSLLGLVRHMAEVERNWFRRVMAGEPAPRLYPTDGPGDLDGAWDGVVADERLVDEAFASMGSVLVAGATFRSPVA